MRSYYRWVGWLQRWHFRDRNQCAGLPAKVPSVAAMRTARMASPESGASAGLSP
jgi:hypothetical protein